MDRMFSCSHGSRYCKIWKYILETWPQPVQWSAGLKYDFLKLGCGGKYPSAIVHPWCYKLHMEDRKSSTPDEKDGDTAHHIKANLTGWINYFLETMNKQSLFRLQENVLFNCCGKCPAQPEGDKVSYRNWPKISVQIDRDIKSTKLPQECSLWIIHN